MRIVNINEYAIFLTKQYISHAVRCCSDKWYFYWLPKESNFGRGWAPSFSPARLIQQLTAHLNAGIKAVEVNSSGLKEKT
jgi:hypothetical protein